MNKLLQEKHDELDMADQYACWYLVKQPTEFDKLCYLVASLKKYQSTEQGENLETFIGNQVSYIREKNGYEASGNYRALRVAAFFGLIEMQSTNYADAKITATFDEITSRCDGLYEQLDTYQDIIKRQIEKIYVSSIIDEQYDSIRKEYRLFPVALLYKILIEVGNATNDYAITYNEYRFLVATTTKYSDFLRTLSLILISRADDEGLKEFEPFRSKFDNRFDRALRQLDTLTFSSDAISISPYAIEEVREKVNIFDKKNISIVSSRYLAFLGSREPLFILSETENEILDVGSATISPIPRNTGGFNTILYGVPGAGKSYTINRDYCDDERYIERLVFHPDYTYSDFVGQILPIVDEDGNVSYNFSPGPFTSLLRKAFANPNNSYYLIIEEINRGNAPAIFGDIFQLLDRDNNGTSEYGITNSDISNAIYDNDYTKIRIPSNMSIIATMNTSDQNVFTLDTAFQRRWNMRMIDNDFARVDPDFANHRILDTSVTWQKFCTEINRIILSKSVRVASAEDKRLGAYFVKISDLVEESPVQNSVPENGYNKISEIGYFPEKVLKYLWDDAFKFSREDIFDIQEFMSLEEVINKFKDSEGDSRFHVFKEEVFLMLTTSSTED